MKTASRAVSVGTDLDAVVTRLVAEFGGTYAEDEVREEAERIATIHFARVRVTEHVPLFVERRTRATLRMNADAYKAG